MQGWMSECSDIAGASRLEEVQGTEWSIVWKVMVNTVEGSGIESIFENGNGIRW